MNSLKKGEGVPLLNFEGGPGSRFPGSRGPGSRSPGPTFTPCLHFEIKVTEAFRMVLNLIIYLEFARFENFRVLEIVLKSFGPIIKPISNKSFYF